MERPTAVRLMGEERQPNRREPDSTEEARGEAPGNSGRAESSAAEHGSGGPAEDGPVMEEVCERSNLWKALKRVQANRGSPGVDGMTVEQLPGQVLQGRWDRTFSEHSYGFRPNRSAHQAVAQAQEYIAGGRCWVVDLDLEKFFDRVNHDKLMGQVAKRVRDRRVLKLIRAFLNAGVMENGLVSPTEEGTPQGGPLSPLLSNLVLNELDRELERRGHSFVRYADDCNIYVRSERAGTGQRGPSRRVVLRPLAVQPQSRAPAGPAHQILCPARLTFTGAIRPRLDQPNRRMRTRMYGGVTGKAREGLPMSNRMSITRRE